MASVTTKTTKKSQFTTSAPSTNVLQEVFGSKPQAPDISSILTQYYDIQSQYLPNIVDLAKRLSDIFTQAGIQQTLQARSALLPGYEQLAQKYSSVLGSLLSGQVPSDVWYQLQRRAAERGVAMGMPGAPVVNTALLRALGLTSLGLQQAGLSAAQQAFSQLPTYDVTNYMPQLVSTLMQAGLPDVSTLLNLSWLQNVLAAAPDPTMAGLWNILSDLAQNQLLLNLTQAGMGGLLSQDWNEILSNMLG